MSKAQLMAFVEEMGHEMEPVLLMGAEDPDSNVTEVDETALVAANDQIRFTAGAHDFTEVMSTTLVESDDEDEDEDEDGDEDGDGFEHRVHS